MLHIPGKADAANATIDKKEENWKYRKIIPVCDT